MSPDNGSELPSPSSDSTTSKSEEEESEARDGSSDPVTGLTDVAKAQLALPQNQNRELLKYKKHLSYQCPAVALAAPLLRLLPTTPLTLFPGRSRRSPPLLLPLSSSITTTSSVLELFVDRKAKIDRCSISKLNATSVSCKSNGTVQ